MIKNIKGNQFKRLGIHSLDLFDINSLINSYSRTVSWSDYFLPSTLQLSSFLKLLLEPIDCKETFMRLELGLQEALVNAVIHGNKNSPEKYIRIRRIMTPNWFIWQIQDQGSGVPKRSRVASLPNSLEATSGRGLFLIHQCFDDVRWSPKGNRLQVAFRRDNFIS